MLFFYLYFIFMVSVTSDNELKHCYCSQWSTIGFQGKDPTTDFHGMGILLL